MRCSIITFFSLYSWALNLPLFSYYSSPLLKTLPDSQRQKTGTAFEVAGFKNTSEMGLPNVQLFPFFAY